MLGPVEVILALSLTLTTAEQAPEDR